MNEFNRDERKNTGPRKVINQRIQIKLENLTAA